jgi:hypothetical protein
MKTTKVGVQQRWECSNEVGSRHFFPPAEDEAAAERPATTRVHCPGPTPRGRPRQSRGTWQNAKGIWARYRCIRPNHNVRGGCSPHLRGAH